jgi:DNA-directed RNA polymerase specialized sigma24 family protein
MTPATGPKTDPKTAAALTAAHSAYLDARTELERLSKARRRAVVKAGEAGWSVYMIARHLGVHDNVVSAILRAAEKENGEKP